MELKFVKLVTGKKVTTSMTLHYLPSPQVTVTGNKKQLLFIPELCLTFDKFDLTRKLYNLNLNSNLGLFCRYFATSKLGKVGLIFLSQRDHFKGLLQTSNYQWILNRDSLRLKAEWTHITVTWIMDGTFCYKIKLNWESVTENLYLFKFLSLLLIHDTKRKEHYQSSLSMITGILKQFLW